MVKKKSMRIIITESQFNKIINEWNDSPMYNGVQEIYYTLIETYDSDGDLDNEEFIIKKLECFDGVYNKLNDKCDEYDIETYVDTTCANSIINHEGNILNKKKYINEDGEQIIETEYYLNCNDEKQYNLSNPNDIDEYLTKRFGLTDNPYLCGFILNNGNMLNLSTKNGVRVIDHSAISSALKISLNDLVRMGYIRVSPESPGFQCFKMPNNKQYYVVKDMVRTFLNNSDLYVDFSERDGYKYNKNTNPERVMSNLIHYFEDGIKPQ